VIEGKVGAIGGSSTVTLKDENLPENVFRYQYQNNNTYFSSSGSSGGGDQGAMLIWNAENEPFAIITPHFAVNYYIRIKV
jgi:hypothetical protein